MGPALLGMNFEKGRGGGPLDGRPLDRRDEEGWPLAGWAAAEVFGTWRKKHGGGQNGVSYGATSGTFEARVLAVTARRAGVGETRRGDGRTMFSVTLDGGKCFLRCNTAIGVTGWKVGEDPPTPEDNQVIGRPAF